MLRRLSLRTRLLVGLIALASIGLVAGDVATYTALRSFLVDRVDSSLEAGHVEVSRFADPNDGRADGGGAGVDRGDPPTQGIDWYQVRTLSGRVIRGGFLIGNGSPPDLDEHLKLPTHVTAGNDDRVVYFTATARDGSTEYRVRASIESQQPKQVFVIATSLHDTFGTLHRLLVVEILVTAGVLVAIVALALWVIRLGLKPLREIEATAATIAGGDLTGRVERAEGSTEVGRLGRSLNAMLSQIESAFNARRESEEKLQASEARLRRFVADASHELRTPLAAVRAYAELFGRGAADRPEDLARSMAGIDREARRMTLLVDDLFLLARLDEGRPLEQQLLDLADVVTESVEAARVLDVARPISVKTEPTPVLGDHDRLRQLLDNLFSNARAHTPAATPVAVDLRREAGNAIVRFSDTGPGLTDEQAAQAFERFYRVDASRARARGGAGLGLSIVSAIAEAHGGTASVEPTAGGGATFVITLPIATSGTAGRAPVESTTVATRAESEIRL